MIQIKVTLIGTLPPLKGNSYYCEKLATTLSKRIQLDFFSFKSLYPNFIYPGGTKEKNNDSYIKSNKNISIKRIITYFNPFSWIKTSFLVKTKIVHAQWWSLPLAPIYIIIFSILKLRKKKIILTVHNVSFHESIIFDKFLTKMVFPFVDIFIAHSKENIKKLEKSFGIRRDKIIIVPMGVHSMYSDSIISKKKAKRFLNLPINKKILLFFGNIREYKGIDDLIKAFSVVNKKIKDSMLLIAGEPWIKWNKYQNLIKKYKLENKIRIHLHYIPKSEVNFFFSASDLVVLPYKFFDAQSGIGNIALAFNKPIVVTNVGGLSELVRDKRAIAKPNNYKNLSEVIMRILEDKKLIKSLSEDSKKLSRIYSWDRIAKKTIKIYEMLSNNPSKNP